MFLPPQDGFTCTKSVAEYLIILCSRKVFGCGGGSWFKPKVKIFLLNWNKHINVTSAVSLRNKVSELPGLPAGKICGGDRLEAPPKSLKAKPVSYPLAVSKAPNTAQGT